MVNISSSGGVTKTRALATKSGENISCSVGVTKSRAFAAKSGQHISCSVGVTKSRAFVAKSGQNISVLKEWPKLGLLQQNVVKTALIYSIVTIARESIKYQFCQLKNPESISGDKNKNHEFGNG